MKFPSIFFILNVSAYEYLVNISYCHILGFAFYNVL